MGEIKRMFKKKRWGKEEWIILILAGLFFMIVFWPDSKEKELKEDEIKQSYEEHKEMDFDTYKEQMEKQLETVLKSIDGIDTVNTMLTFATSEEEVVLRNIKNTIETTSEEDSQGGKRTIEAKNYEETACYTQDKGEENTPYITYTVAPKVEGALIVVGGERASLLRTEIVRAVQALFDVESHKVVVIKM